VTRACLLEGLEKGVHLGVAADELGEAAGGGSLETGSHGARSRQREGLHRAHEPLHAHRTHRLDLDEARCQVQRVGGHQDGARVRHLLHPRGEVGRLSDGRVIHVEVGGDGADHDLARVQPYADADGHALHPPHPIGVLLDRLLHA